MYTLLALAVLAQPPAPAAPGGAPPEQVLASIDGKGKLTLIHATCACYGPAAQETVVTAYETQGKDRVPVKAKVKVSSVVVTTAEIPAKFVEAYTTDGKAIPADELAKLLAKDRTVLVAMDGKKLDPFYLQLYKEGTIVLVPPANTLGAGSGAYGGGLVPMVVPAPLLPRVDPGPPPAPLPPERNR